LGDPDPEVQISSLDQMASFSPLDLNSYISFLFLKGKKDQVRIKSNETFQKLIVKELLDNDDNQMSSIISNTKDHFLDSKDNVRLSAQFLFVEISQKKAYDFIFSNFSDHYQLIFHDFPY
jgi:hypothetical protein